MIFERFFRWFAHSEPDMYDESLDDVRPRRRGFSTTPLPGTRFDNPGEIALTHPKFTAAISIEDGTVPEGATFDAALKSYGMDSTQLKQRFTLGQGAIPDDLFQWFSSQGFIGYQACAIVSQHWLVGKALFVPAKDAVRNGYTLGSVTEDDLDVTILAQLQKADKKYQIPKNLIEYATNTRRFGIRFAIFNVESSDEEYYKKPFNIDGVKPGSYKGITQVDPSWIAPVLDQEAAANPASMDFYEPTYWLVGGQLYHRSHLIVSRYVDPPDILKPSYQYGGIPLTQLILERVYAAERTANEAPMLAETKRLNIVYTDIAAVTANPGGFETRLAQLIGYRNNYGAYVADTEDRLEQIETSLADLDNVIMSQYQLVAAVSEIPATKLLGTSPKGFNATGEFEEGSYYDLLENIQTDLTSVLDRHYEILIRSEKLGDVAVEVVWNPTSSPDAKEQAEINLIDAQRDNALMLSGAIEADEIRDRLIADPKSGYSFLESFENMDEFTGEELDFGEHDGPGGSAKGAKAPPGEEQKPTGAKIETVSVEDYTKFDRDCSEALAARRVQKPVKTEDHGESNVLGYVRITPSLSTGAKLHLWAVKAGISEPTRASEFHSTLMWSRVGIPDYAADDSEYTLIPTKVGILSEEKPALVVFVDSAQLRVRAKVLEDMGGVSDYPEFIPHIALKYDPTPEDLESARAYYEKNPLGKIVMGGEIRQVL